MQLIWHGTASIEAVCEKGRILFDPFVPLKGSPVDVKIEEFYSFTDIFVTHGHIDHITDIPKIVKHDPDVMIYCTPTPFRTLIKKGVSAKNLTVLRYGDVRHVYGFTIRVMHGKHAILPSFSPGLFQIVDEVGYARQHPVHRPAVRALSGER